jgi:hypothetical protein
MFPSSEFLGRREYPAGLIAPERCQAVLSAKGHSQMSKGISASDAKNNFGGFLEPVPVQISRTLT